MRDHEDSNPHMGSLSRAVQYVRLRHVSACSLAYCRTLSRGDNASDSATLEIFSERHSRTVGKEYYFASKSSHEASSYVSEPIDGNSGTASPRDHAFRYRRRSP